MIEHEPIWVLEKLYPQIYHLQFDNKYDTAMHSLRYQEYCESPVWKGQNFKLIDYMEWYAKTQCKWEKEVDGELEKKKFFSYPGDWVGFNLPCTVFDDLSIYIIQDPNKYDYFMQNIVRLIKQNDSHFYLIGTTSGDDLVIDHEISHGLFFLDSTYEDASYDLLDKMDQELRTQLHDWMLKKGYCKEVFDDEVTAYMATGLPTAFDTKENRKEQKPFKQLFEETLRETR